MLHDNDDENYYPFAVVSSNLRDNLQIHFP